MNGPGASFGARWRLEILDEGQTPRADEDEDIIQPPQKKNSC